MSKIKIADDNKISIHTSKSEPYCKQWKEDVLFELNDNKALKSYFELIETISKSTWVELQTRSRFTKGGFETLEYWRFYKKIANEYNKEMSEDIKLYVFRFGNADKYRMVGYKSHNCSRTFHVLGFDLDFSLYDH